MCQPPPPPVPVNVYSHVHLGIRTLKPLMSYLTLNLLMGLPAPECRPPTQAQGSPPRLTLE